MNRIWIVPLLVMAPLSGCVVDAPGEGSDEGLDLLDMASTPTFGDATFIGAGSTPGAGVPVETSLAVGAGGSMLVCSVDESAVWASEDGGVTWRALDPFEGLPNGDCDVAVDDAGRYYAIFARWTGPAGDHDLAVAVSEDKGETWVVHHVKPPAPLYRHCPVPPYGVCFAHRAWLRPVGDTLYLVTANVVPMAIVLTKSTDAGATWSDPVVVEDGRVGVAGDITVSPDGKTVHVPVGRFVPTDAETWLGWFGILTSRDAGASFTMTEIAGPIQSALSIATLAQAADGDLYYGLSRTGGSGFDLLVAVSGDDGQTWSEPSAVATGIDFPGMPHIALDRSPAGGVVGAWYHWTDREGGPGWAVDAVGLDARGDELVRWSSPVTHPDGVEGSIEFWEMRHDTDGRLHLVYPVPNDPCPGTQKRDCVEHVLGSVPP